MKLSLLSTLALSGLTNASPQFQLPLNLNSDSSSPSTSNSLDQIIDSSPFLSLHRELVQISSLSGHESSVGSFLTNYLSSRNFTVIQQPVPGQTTRFNIIAYPSGDDASSTPEILLTSHIDTVPPFIPYSLHQNDDAENPNESNSRENILIAGRGSVDAKASVAALIFAALETLSNTPSAPLALLFVVDEEVGGAGMHAFSANTTFNPSPSPYHTVIFGEPTDLALVAGHKGILEFKLRATGHAAHSGYPWLGESAISSILPALSIVDRLGDIPAEEGGLPPSPKYGRTTVNIGRVDAGVAANVVPASAIANVAVRLAAGTPDEAREIIRRAVQNATGQNPHVEVDFGSGGYPPQDLDTDVPGFAITTVNYGTDVPNLVLEGDVKRYLYGPGSIHVAHGDKEAITVRQLEEAVNGYKRLIDAGLARTSNP